MAEPAGDDAAAAAEPAERSGVDALAAIEGPAATAATAEDVARVSSCDAGREHAAVTPNTTIPPQTGFDVTVG